MLFFAIINFHIFQKANIIIRFNFVYQKKKKNQMKKKSKLYKMMTYQDTGKWKPENVNESEMEFGKDVLYLNIFTKQVNMINDVVYIK